MLPAPTHLDPSRVHASQDTVEMERRATVCAYMWSMGQLEHSIMYFRVAVAYVNSLVESITQSMLC